MLPRNFLAGHSLGLTLLERPPLSIIFFGGGKDRGIPACRQRCKGLSQTSWLKEGCV